MSQVVSTCSSLDHPCIEGLIVINANRSRLFSLRRVIPQQIYQTSTSPPQQSTANKKMLQGPPPLSDVGRGCQDMLRWSGQNANQKVGPDKMPTTEKKSRTKCQPRLAFCPVGILSTHQSYTNLHSCRTCFE